MTDEISVKEKIFNFLKNLTNNNIEERFREVLRSDVLDKTSEAYEEIRKLVNQLEIYRIENDFTSWSEEGFGNYIYYKFHIQRFSKKYFDKHHELSFKNYQKVHVEPNIIASLGISPHFIFSKDCGVYGGAARTVLKKILGLDLVGELPLNDIDVFILSHKITSSNNLSIVDTKILDSANDIEQEILTTIFYDTDLTINQVMIYDGYIYYTDEAARDLGKRLLKGTQQNGMGIFEPTSITVGNQNYFLRSGLYRVFSLLLSQKADGIDISHENMNAVGSTVGRYWINLLMVKLSKIKSETNKKLAFYNWYVLAVSCGATRTSSPCEFLDELVLLNPVMKKYFLKEAITESRPSEQMKWLIGRFENTFLNKISPNREIFVPDNMDFYIQQRPIEALNLLQQIEIDSFIKKLKT